jgi:exonuclease III
VFLNVYKPPASNFVSFIDVLNRILHDLNANENIILGGDFNIDFKNNNLRHKSGRLGQVKLFQK